MEKSSLTALARELLEHATRTSSGRSADTVYGGHEHVLRGRVRLSTDDAAWEGVSGDLIIVPAVRHSLEALEDSAVLLTVAKLS